MTSMHRSRPVTPATAAPPAVVRAARAGWPCALAVKLLSVGISAGQAAGAFGSGDQAAVGIGGVRAAESPISWNRTRRRLPPATPWC